MITSDERVAQSKSQSLPPDYLLIGHDLRSTVPDRSENDTAKEKQD